MDGPIELNKVNHPVFTEKWEINCFCNIFVIRKNDFNRLLKVCRIWTFSFSNLCKSHCLFTEYRHFNQFCVWKNEGFWWNFLVQTQQFVQLFFKDIKFILIFWTQFRSKNQGFSQGNIVTNVLWVSKTWKNESCLIWSIFNILF